MAEVVYFSVCNYELISFLYCEIYHVCNIFMICMLRKMLLFNVTLMKKNMSTVKSIIQEILIKEISLINCEVMRFLPTEMYQTLDFLGKNFILR